MFEKIFGKKKSIQRAIIKYFIIAIISVVIVSIIGFKILINDQAIHKLVEFDINSNNEIAELGDIIKRGVIVIILNTILISTIVIRISMKKMLEPITKLNEATKKVAQGDFSVKLETTREDEISELTTNFNKMVQDLGSIEYLQKEFIDNVSHEIKTPISSIEGFAELLTDEELSLEEKKEYSNIIKEEANRLLNLSTNMLKLSKLQNQNKITNKEQVDITEQIKKAIQLLEPKWNEKEIIFNVSLEEKYFYGNEDLMFQVWVNLIENAIKFSNQHEKIDISLKEIENHLEIKIKDNGIGMTQDDMDMIFNRFYQIDKSRSTGGNGLGLAIVKRIIDLSEGTIDVISEENVGTTFIVKLPIEKENNKIII